LQSSHETRVGFFVLIALFIFAYMSFQTGAFRFDRLKYNSYVVQFKDISGLARKADVKIAGVKVGWVKKVGLSADEERDQMRAQAELMVLKEYALYSDAHAVVRQDGLLGPRYVELVPGDPFTRTLKSGEQIEKPSAEPVSIDELMVQLGAIAKNINEVSDSFKQVIGGDEGRDTLNTMVRNFSDASARIAGFADKLDNTVSRNADKIDEMFDVGVHIQRVAVQLEENVLPTVQENVDRIATVFDRDFDRVATKFESTTQSLEEATVQAREGLRSVSAVAEKINEGQGILGKLINDDEGYRDFKSAVQGVKNYVTKIDRLHTILDCHSESMHCRAENYTHEDSKGYFTVRIYPNQNHFYLIEAVSSEKGFVYREETDHRYYDMGDRNCIDGTRVDVTKLPAPELRPSDFLREKVEIYRRNTIKLGLQFGKVFNNISLRFGLFEGFAGVGADINIPFRNGKFAWTTTFEAFDFRGWNRRSDRRPHLKWLNKMYLFPNIYFDFGADDFISKYNASVFFGVGMRFGDDDVKYLISNIGSINSLSTVT
jgi:phospholipid/cholesterol/gamma-HCH transport system substrate-binding protein